MAAPRPPVNVLVPPMPPNKQVRDLATATEEANALPQIIVFTTTMVHNGLPTSQSRATADHQMESMTTPAYATITI